MGLVICLIKDRDGSFKISIEMYVVIALGQESQQFSMLLFTSSSFQREDYVFFENIWKHHMFTRINVRIFIYICPFFGVGGLVNPISLIYAPLTIGYALNSTGEPKNSGRSADNL